jgi:hypothetical protein
MNNHAGFIRFPYCSLWMRFLVDLRSIGACTSLFMGACTLLFISVVVARSLKYSSSSGSHITLYPLKEGCIPYYRMSSIFSYYLIRSITVYGSSSNFAVNLFLFLCLRITFRFDDLVCLLSFAYSIFLYYDLYHYFKVNVRKLTVPWSGMQSCMKLINCFRHPLFCLSEFNIYTSYKLFFCGSK